MKIFISYSHQNENIADELVALMKETFPNKLSFFKAKSDSTHQYTSVYFGDWLKTIQKNLINSNVVIGIITKEYISSKWFFAELGGALFFEKIVIPICITPIKKIGLPAPFDRLQAYSYKKEDIAIMLSNLAINHPLLSYSSVDLKAYPLLSKEKNFEHKDNRAATIFNSFFSKDDIQKFIYERKMMGDHLASLYNEYKLSISMSSIVLSDNYGNAQITRHVKLRPDNYMSHWYYSVVIDEDGSIDIKEIIDVNSQSNLQYLVHRRNSREVFISILFGRTIKKGEEINLKISIHAENFMSDLIKNGLCQIFYNNPRNTKITSYSQLLSFPNTSIFKDLVCYIISSGGDSNNLYKPINPVIKEGRKDIKFEISSLEGFTDRVLFELRI